jgi:hypothetical protein
LLQPVWLNGLNVPCVAAPFRVTLSALVLLSTNVLLLAPLVPLACINSVVVLNRSSVRPLPLDPPPLPPPPEKIFWKNPVFLMLAAPKVVIIGIVRSYANLVWLPSTVYVLMDVLMIL